MSDMKGIFRVSVDICKFVSSESKTSSKGNCLCLLCGSARWKGARSISDCEDTIAYPACLEGSLSALSSINQSMAGSGRGVSLISGKGYKKCSVMSRQLCRVDGLVCRERLCWILGCWGCVRFGPEG